MFFKIAAKTAGVMANYKQLEAIDSTPNYCDTSLTEKGKSYLMTSISIQQQTIYLIVTRPSRGKSLMPIVIT